MAIYKPGARVRLRYVQWAPRIHSLYDPTTPWKNLEQLRQEEQK